MTIVAWLAAASALLPFAAWGKRAGRLDDIAGRWLGDVEEFFFRRATSASNSAIRAFSGATASATAVVINTCTCSGLSHCVMPLCVTHIATPRNTTLVGCGVNGYRPLGIRKVACTRRVPSAWRAQKTHNFSECRPLGERKNVPLFNNWPKRARCPPCLVGPSFPPNKGLQQCDNPEGG